MSTGLFVFFCQFSFSRNVEFIFVALAPVRESVQTHTVFQKNCLRVSMITDLWTEVSGCCEGTNEKLLRKLSEPDLTVLFRWIVNCGHQLESSTLTLPDFLRLQSIFSSRKCFVEYLTSSGSQTKAIPHKIKSATFIHSWPGVNHDKTSSGLI